MTSKKIITARILWEKIFYFHYSILPLRGILTKMTVEQNKLFTSLETEVRHLLILYHDARVEREELARKLEDAESKLSEVKMVVKDWETKYENLRLAKIISVSEQETQKTQHNLSKLEREIEKCIALLNE